MISIKDLGNNSFLFVFDSAEQMRDFFEETKAKKFFSDRTAAYNLCANNIRNKKMTVAEQNGSVYIVKENDDLWSDTVYTVDLSGRISGKGTFGEHRQSTGSKILTVFPAILETIARKYPNSTFCGAIHDTDFDWWETTITYEYKDGVLTIKRDGYSEDGPDSARTGESIISIY